MQTIRGSTYMVTTVDDQKMYLDLNHYGLLVKKYGTELASANIRNNFRDATYMGLKGRKRSQYVITKLEV
jgi:hypothetical protein